MMAMAKYSLCPSGTLIGHSIDTHKDTHSEIDRSSVTSTHACSHAHILRHKTAPCSQFTDDRIITRRLM
jgi:hypothetical protein